MRKRYQGLAAAAILAIPALTGCYGMAGLAYTGDGSMRDHGAITHDLRYEIDLGTIEAKAGTVRHYQLSGLPRATFTVNIEVADNDRDRRALPQAQYRGRIAVALKNAAGELAIEERDAIERWERSYNLDRRNSSFYRSGQSIGEPLPGGRSATKPIGVKASGGWGTYFDSEPGQRYTLTVEVIEPLSPAAPTRISVTGWDR